MLVSFTRRTPASVNNQPRPRRWEAGQILTKRPRTPTRRRVQHLEQPSHPGTEIRAIGGRAFLDELKEDVARLEAGENATSVPASGRRARSGPSRVRRGREASQVAPGFAAADATVPRPDHVRTGLMIDRREADALDRACMVALSRSFLRTAFRVSILSPLTSMYPPAPERASMAWHGNVIGIATQRAVFSGDTVSMSTLQCNPPKQPSRREKYRLSDPGNRGRSAFFRFTSERGAGVATLPCF